LLLLCTGCLSQSSLDGFPLNSSFQHDGAVFYVEHQSKDERNLDKIVAAKLLGHGLNVVTDATETADFTVTYVDRWQWDMRMYLIDLRIDVRDAETRVLVATGRSYQTSVSAMGRSHEEIIAAAVDVIVDGVTRSPPPKRSGNRRRR
jgi:AmiR/NasT family two-component response regulator